ncbi:carboxylesterase family protein [Xylariaceae sp. FL1651]|nr:carboxylesterase family protein [Xylariaceae sp. FL1651]
MRSSYGLAIAFPFLAVANDLPVVDLGYARHRAIGVNETGDYYNFTNIRYGQAPVGDLRWAEPKAPLNISSSANLTVFDGSEQGGNCPQTFPCWFQIQTAFTEAYLAGEEFDFDKTYAEVYADGVCSKPVPEDERLPFETEDCLFLDVFAPRSIFDKASNASSTGAPVLVYIFGGGYSGGSKSNFGYFDGSPAGLIDSSRVTSPDGLIYVAINYRLGALGFMFGSDYASQGGIVNAGLYDQRLALQWVQQNIHLFGGDPNRVTVMGESAGGGSILMQMTAFGTGEKAPFQQVITQSAAWEPSSAGPALQNQLFGHWLDLLNVSTLAEARQLPTREIIDANHIILSSADYGSVFLGPVVDGVFVPDDPKRLLRDGRVDTSLKLLTTVASNEGLRFAPANITSEADFVQFVDLFLDGANQSVRDHVLQNVYPPVFDGSLPYEDQLQRAGLFWAELVSTCNAQYMHSAMAQPGYANLFDVWPALHQGDVPYVFWNGPLTHSSVNGSVARVIQDYITAFAITGDPNNSESPELPVYDLKSTLGMTASGYGVVADPTINERCAYWHDATYQP